MKTLIPLLLVLVTNTACAQLAIRSLNGTGTNTTFYDGNNIGALSIGGRELVDDSAVSSLQWGAGIRLLNDGAGQSAVDWGSRELRATDGSTVALNWNTKNLGSGWTITNPTNIGRTVITSNLQVRANSSQAAISVSNLLDVVNQDGSHVVVTTNGNVGIGTNNPGVNALHATKSGSVATMVQFGSVTPIIFNADTSGNTSSSFSMKNVTRQWELYSNASGPLSVYDRTGNKTPFVINNGNAIGLGGDMTGVETSLAGATMAITNGNVSIGNGLTVGQAKLDVTGDIRSSLGFASYRSNLLAAATVAVGASPFSFTNTIGVDIDVYVDGISVTGTQGINGGTVYNSIGQNHIRLHPLDYTTLTYTLGSPTMTWRP